ncbi:MAG: glycosyltransferase family 2 protein [Magnetococcus sp. DMHC-1]|nr:glycosyltransferase [Magnetococcales bacterium]
MADPHDTSDLTIVIPAKNEAATIVEIVQRCQCFATRILVLDGRSTDGTGDKAAAAGAQVITVTRNGKGSAIREAIHHITTPLVVFIDADGSHVVEDIPQLVAPLREGRADHVHASRLIGGSSELHGSFSEFFRLAGSAFITACINWRFKACLSESQNGFRALTMDLLRQLDLQETITTIEQEMVIKTLHRRARLLEIPSHEHKRRYGESNIRLWRVAFRYVYSLIKYMFFK